MMKILRAIIKHYFNAGQDFELNKFPLGVYCE